MVSRESVRIRDDPTPFAEGAVNTYAMHGALRLKGQNDMSTTGQIIDKLLKLRNRRLAASRKVENLRAEERVIEEDLVANLRSQKLEKASGKFGSFSYRVVPVGKVEDWDAFYKYIKRTGAFELLERRVAQKPLRERLEDTKSAPKGVVIESFVKVSLTAKR